MADYYITQTMLDNAMFNFLDEILAKENHPINSRVKYYNDVVNFVEEKILTLNQDNEKIEELEDDKERLEDNFKRFRNNIVDNLEQVISDLMSDSVRSSLEIVKTLFHYVKEFEL